MPYPAQSAAAVRVPPARTAPYALIRTTALPLPAQSAAAAALRVLVDRLTAVEAEEAALRPALGDDLFASRAAHTEEFHRQVVLPLRRALYNGRTPGVALLERLDDLPARVPRLADWLALQERRTDLLDELELATPPALAAERAALAALCRSPDFTRAIALTSADLLRAVTTAGRGEGGRRARKEEPTVLRHALRAASKTSPLSWFTTVGWAADTTAATTTDATTAATAAATAPATGRAALRAVVRENRTLVGALTEALLAEPRRRRALPHRMTSSARVADGRAHYARSQVLFAGGRHLVTREEKVELAARAPLDVLAALTADPAPCALLAEQLATALGRPPGDPSVTGFVDRLTETGLLVPSDPVHPQDRAPLRRLADWLRGWPEDADLADRIDQLADATAGFATTPADRRPALLATLGADWHRLLADTGRPVPADAAPLTVLSEDVVAPGALPADRLLDQADHAALGELTALAELFDLGHLMRRAARDRFVARYGPGGSCPHPWEFGAELAAAWEDAGRPADPARIPGEREELTALRREFIATGPAGDGPEVVLPADLVRDLAARLPDWTAARPLSYSYFVQRDHADALLCVNHVYGGWGRFTSRFLDTTAPGAADAVTRQIRHGLGDGARAAQIRPVGGFNANLHPLLLADEIGPDRRWTSLAEHDLDLVHDPVGDQLRLRLRATGELLDVLYLGFLAPVMLPQRIGPLLADHPNGVVDFRPLLPRRTLPAPGGEVVRTPRLRHRHLVLARRRWHLPAPVLDALRADLAADQEVPVATAARWRALLDLPDRLFLHPVPAAPAGRPVEDFLARLNAPKPQALDLGNALHLRCLAKWLTRHPGGAVLEEALPAAGGHDRPRHAVELVVEAYRPARPARPGPQP
ncbi:lantibiotic dehydratase [Kitasatospora sp. NPDC058170]|uniref:lantibiotic dehydratase n=1 Tax=Kitasatospora sp. NPDC058170 TaxID=3346364 RepID=UPI0036DF4BAA